MIGLLSIFDKEWNSTPRINCVQNDFAPILKAREDRAEGFSLIELLIVIGIMSILSAIAVPAYRDYVMRGRITEATSNLAAKQVQLEQFFQDNRTYLGASACDSDTTTSENFDFSCSVQSATAFTLLATGKSSMAGFTYSVTQSNVKSTAALPSGWTAHTPDNCWVTKKGGVC